MATKKAQKEYGTVGEIGTNVPVMVEEREEDLLEHIYTRWRSGESMRPIDIAEANSMKTREFNQLVKRMTAHGYLYQTEPKCDLELTDFGKTQGAECMNRHHVITQFIQTVSGQDEQRAREEACRVEHVISRATVRGISGFLQNGDTYDRVYEGMDLCQICGFPAGEHSVNIGIYYMERRCPRIVAVEHDTVNDMALLIVDRGGSRIVLQSRDSDESRILWYIQDGNWRQARWEKDAWVLPTRVFRIEKSAAMPILEATLRIALVKDGQVPIVLDCRDLCVHIW